jgi:hypothetical protein
MKETIIDHVTGETLSIVPSRLVLKPRSDGVSSEVARRAEDFVNSHWSSFTEAVLIAHFLLEQALTQRIRLKFTKPDVLDQSRFGFAQLLTIYEGLYGPDPRTIEMLKAFNRLRNRTAHTLDDADSLIGQHLAQYAPPQGFSKSHRGTLGAPFLHLFFGELGGVASAEWEPEESSEST